MEEVVTLPRKVLKSLGTYLTGTLRVDKDFISGLSVAGLLGESDADRLGSLVTQGGNEALYGLLHYVEWYYDEEMLERFCAFLEEKSKSAKPIFSKIAERIRGEMKRYQPHPTQPAESQQDVPVPSGPPSSPPATQGEPTPTVFTMDERSQKIEEIVDMYRSGKVSLPEIPELEDDFDNIMGRLNAELSSADPKVICELQGMLGVKYRRYIQGETPGKVPSIPDTARGLYQFIAEKSTTYEILLIHHAVEVLNCEDLRRTLQNYESKLADHLRLTLESYKKRKVTLPLHKHHTHLAVVLPKEQVLLSLVLHIKRYLKKYLQLEEAMFEGFVVDSTILFFSILRIDAVLLGPKVLSHSAELKRMFDITHLVVFDYFACDLERATIELPEKHECKMRELEASLEEAKQIKDQLVSTMMKERVKLMEAQKDAEMFKKSTVQLEEKLRQSLVEKKEMDSLLSSLQTKQKELEGDESLLERDKLIAALKEEVATLKATLEQKDEELETTRQELSDPENRLEGAVKVSKDLETTTDKLSDTKSTEDDYPELYGSMKSVQISDRESRMKLFEEEKLKLSHLYWRKEPDVLEGIQFPTAVCLNGKIFVGDRRFVHHLFLRVFDVVSRTWSKLPFPNSREMYGFTLATSNKKVHTVGGTWRKDGKVEEYSNEVFSLDGDLKWCNTLPPLNIGRRYATSTSFDSFILVAGGKGWNGWLSSVEVLNSSQSSSTWWEICDLPVESRLMQCTVTHDELFIGCSSGGTVDTVYTAKLSAVKESLNVDEDSESSVSPQSFWQSLPQTPLLGSGLVSVNNCLLTVGGHDGVRPYSSVHLYHCKKTEIS